MVCPISQGDHNQAQSKYKHSLTFLVRRHVVSYKTCAPIANPPSSAQLEGTPTIPQVTPGSLQQCGNAAWDRQTHRRPWPLYISPRLCLTRNVITRCRTELTRCTHRADVYRTRVFVVCTGTMLCQSTSMKLSTSTVIAKVGLHQYMFVTSQPPCH